MRLRGLRGLDVAPTRSLASTFRQGRPCSLITGQTAEKTLIITLLIVMERRGSWTLLIPDPRALVTAAETFYVISLLHQEAVMYMLAC